MVSLDLAIKNDKWDYKQYKQFRKNRNQSFVFADGNIVQTEILTTFR